MAGAGRGARHEADARAPQPSTAIYAIGAILLVYGAGEALVVLLLSLVGLQDADENAVVLPAFVFAPVIPALSS